MNKLIDFIKKFTICSLAAILFIFISWSCKLQHSASSGYEKKADIRSEADSLSKRIFYLSYGLEKNPKLKEIIVKDDILYRFFLTKEESLQHAILNCTDMDCMVEAISLSEDENDEIISRLSKIYNQNNQVFSDFMQSTIRPSHSYEFYTHYSDSALFIKAWEEERNGINYIYKAYLQNKGLIYPRVDSAKFEVGSMDYLKAVKQIVQHSIKDKKSNVFFRFSKDIAIAILQLNDRDEAIRFYPLSKVNQEAYTYIPTIKWEDYSYSGVLVLGIGPKNNGIALSEGGKRNCRMGVKLYRDKKTPLIVVSGGYVHPYGTPFCEAEQMKIYLMDSLGIPEKAVIMEPHARHTTTNIRNTNRIFLRHGVPGNLPIILASNKRHMDYIVSDRFRKVYLRDIGFVTHSRLSRISDTTASYYPTMSSFQINTTEPLDP